MASTTATIATIIATATMRATPMKFSPVNEASVP